MLAEDKVNTSTNSVAGQAEKYLERVFELLQILASEGPVDVKQIICGSSGLLHKTTLQSQIYESLAEPSAATFSVTKWLMRIISTCSANEQLIKTIAD